MKKLNMHDVRNLDCKNQEFSSSGYSIFQISANQQNQKMLNF